MAHQHSVYDTDPHFKIDSFSRAITDLSEKQIKLMQGDHNSERFTFEIDRRVDGHDMTKCDRVEVHYLNVDGSTKESFGDVYEVDDMSTSPVSDNVVIFSWLVSKNATGYAGTLNFRIRFVCTDESGNVVYAWHTDIFKGITVSSGISNTAAAVEEYSDVLAKWQRDLFEQGSTSVANVNVAREAAISAVQDEGAAQIAAVEAKGAATLESIPNDFSAVAAEAEANTAAIVEVDEHRAALESRTTRQAKLIKNLSQAIQNTNDGITPDPYDSAPAFKWSVPENALPFAKIREIGGVTRKCTNLAAPVKEHGIYGFEVSPNLDNSITISGAAVSSTNIVIDLIDTDKPVKMNANEVYSFSVTKEGVSASTGCVFEYTDAIGGTVYGWNNQDTTRPRLLKRIYLQFTPTVGGTDPNGTYYVMVNKGAFAQPYEPFFEGLRSAPVYEVVSEGVNLASPFNIGKGVDDITGAINERSTQACTDLIRIQGVTSCVWSGVESSLFSCIYFYNSAKKYMGRSVAGGRSQWVITSQLLTANLTNVGGEVTYIRLWYGENATVTGTIDLINNTHSMLNKGTTALPYRPYIKRTLALPEAVRNLPDYGVGIPDTEYFNRIRWRYDEQTDKWVSEHERQTPTVDMGTLTWERFGSGGDGVFRCNIFDRAIATDILCSMFEKNLTVQSANDLGDHEVYVSPTSKYLYFKNSAYTDATSFKSAMSGVMLVYELATPEITDISDILPEDNLLGVEAGGTITAENEFGYAVPMIIK